MKRLLWIPLVLLAIPAWADDFPARETADVGPVWTGSVGVFNPLRLAVADGVELEVHPLIFLTAPHVDVRVAHQPGAAGDIRVTGEYGLSLPTGALRLAKPLGLSGDLVPSCKVAAKDPALAGECQKAPWTLVGHAGVVVSGDVGLSAEATPAATWTLRADVAKGLVFSGGEVRPLDAWAPVDVSLAPSLGYTRAQVRGQWDQRVLAWLRVRTEVGLWLTTQAADADRSPLAVSAYLGTDLRTSIHTRLTLGAVYWNSDRHQVVVHKGADGFAEVVRVRSHEVWPTVDFLWSF